MKNKIINFKELDELALYVYKFLEKGGTLGLIGDLGVGKTTFAKRICKYFGITENVKSPTFTYLIEYTSGKKPVYHFDAYRIINSEEIYEIGFEDYIREDGVVIVEWANNIIDEMPEDTLYVEISHNDESTREVSVYKLINGEKEYVEFCNNYNK